MKTIDLIQGTAEWLEWRRRHITSTDITAIVGVSPFCTAQKLFLQKKDPSYQSVENEAMRRGKILEKEAIDFASSMLGIRFTPCVIEGGIYGASLDGINEENRIFVEAKCPGDKVFKEAILGKLPLYWKCQIHWQLFVSDFEYAYLCVYDGFDGKIIRIDRDQDYIDSMKSKADEWWAYFINNESPPPSENDYVSIEINNDQHGIVLHWLAAQKDLKQVEQSEKEWSQIIKSWGDDGNCELIYNGTPLLKMARVQRDGLVDWKAVCLAKGITEEDLKPFKKEQIGYYKLIRSK